MYDFSLVLMIAQQSQKVGTDATATVTSLGLNWENATRILANIFPSYENFERLIHTIKDSALMTI
jgi:hypothetical protein